MSWPQRSRGVRVACIFIHIVEHASTVSSSRQALCKSDAPPAEIDITCMGGFDKIDWGKVRESVSQFVSVHTHTHMQMHAHTRARLHTHTYIHTHTHKHKHIHTHKHTYIHTHTRARTAMSS